MEGRICSNQYPEKAFFFLFVNVCGEEKEREREREGMGVIAFSHIIEYLFFSLFLGLSVQDFPSSFFFFRSSDDLGKLNPALYRDESMEAASAPDDCAGACAGSGAFLRFRLDYVRHREWLEVTVVKIKAAPRDTREVGIK